MLWKWNFELISEAGKWRFFMFFWPNVGQDGFLMLANVEKLSEMIFGCFLIPRTITRMCFGQDLAKKQWKIMHYWDPGSSSNSMNSLIFLDFSTYDSLHFYLGQNNVSYYEKLFHGQPSIKDFNFGHHCCILILFTLRHLFCFPRKTLVKNPQFFNVTNFSFFSRFCFEIRLLSFFSTILVKIIEFFLGKCQLQGVPTSFSENLKSTRN